MCSIFFLPILKGDLKLDEINDILYVSRYQKIELETFDMRNKTVIAQTAWDSPICPNIRQCLTQDTHILHEAQCGVQEGHMASLRLAHELRLQDIIEEVVV